MLQPSYYIFNKKVRVNNYSFNKVLHGHGKWFMLHFSLNLMFKCGIISDKYKSSLCSNSIFYSLIKSFLVYFFLKNFKVKSIVLLHGNCYIWIDFSISFIFQLCIGIQKNGNKKHKIYIYIALHASVCNLSIPRLYFMLISIVIINSKHISR